jgi:hypothetical protein
MKRATPKCAMCRAGPEVWVAQARPDVSCPLLLKKKKKKKKVNQKKKKAKSRLHCVFLA